MEEPVFSVRDLAINGNDLMKIGIYGKDIGVALNQILDKVISGDIDNNYDSISKYLSNFIVLRNIASPFSNIQNGIAIIIDLISAIDNSSNAVNVNEDIDNAVA